jgi:hypothetical protein
MGRNRHKKRDKVTARTHLLVALPTSTSSTRTFAVGCVDAVRACVETWRAALAGKSITTKVPAAVHILAAMVHILAAMAPAQQHHAMHSMVVPPAQNTN